MDADGSGQERLTHTPDDEYFLAWSPDGESIAYSTNPSYAPEIWVMDADGSDRKQLEDGLFPSWSPGGERIAYTAYSGEQPYIAVMNADGSGRRRLGASVLQRFLNLGGAGEEPVWTPDGEKIAFASEDKKGSEIYVMNSDGSGLTNLTDALAAEDFYPAWRP